MERPKIELLLAQHPADAGEHVDRTAIGLDDVLQDTDDFLRLGPIGGEQALQRLRIGQRRRQRLVDLVRHRREDLSHARPHVEMRHLVQRLLHFCFGTLPGRDVDVRDHGAAWPPQQTLDAHVRPFALAVRLPGALDDPLLVDLVEHRAKCFAQPGRVNSVLRRSAVGVQPPLTPPGAHERVLGLRRGPGPPVVAGHDVPVPIDHRQVGGHRCQHGMVLCFRAAPHTPLDEQHADDRGLERHHRQGHERRVPVSLKERRFPEEDFAPGRQRGFADSPARELPRVEHPA